MLPPLPKGRGRGRGVAATRAAVCDVQEASIYESYTIPKLNTKMQYCVSCAIHSHVAPVRSRTDRHKREPRQCFRHRDDMN